MTYSVFSIITNTLCSLVINNISGIFQLFRYQVIFTCKYDTKILLCLLGQQIP